ncbi:MAG: hypothetical protein JST40_11460 [Armatimonadetes bacterium]|nr:hypothetical protein [Armatimonadota bacterium]
MKICALFAAVASFCMGYASPIDADNLLQEGAQATDFWSVEQKFGGLKFQSSESDKSVETVHGSHRRGDWEGRFWKMNNGLARVYSGVLAISYSQGASSGERSDFIASLKRDAPQLLNHFLESRGEEKPGKFVLNWRSTSVSGAERAETAEAPECEHSNSQCVVIEAHGRIYVVVSSVAVQRGVSFSELMVAGALQSQLFASLTVE